MYCTQCGNEVYEEDEFCEECGATVRRGNEEPEGKVKFCTKCKNKIFLSDNFCSKCGKEVRKGKKPGITPDTPVMPPSVPGSSPIDRDIPISNELMDYLNAVFELEGNKYFLEQAISNEKTENDNIQGDINGLYIKKNRRPEKVSVPRNASFEEDVLSSAANTFSKYQQYVWIPVFIIAVIVFIMTKNPIVGVIVGAILAVLAFLVFMLVAYYTKYLDQKGAYDYAVHANDRIEDDFRGECERTDIEIKKKNNLLAERKEVIPALQKRLDQVKNVLNNYYSLNIIHKDFRFLEAIAYIRFYLESGQAKSLGAAYTLCETAQFRKAVVRQNSEIIISLRDVQASNKAIYEKVNDVKNYISILHDDIQKQTKSINDMNSSINNMNSNMNARMDAINDSINRNTKIQEINNSVLKSINNYESYQAFAARQERLANGHWQ